MNKKAIGILGVITTVGSVALSLVSAFVQKKQAEIDLAEQVEKAIQNMKNN